MDRIATHAGRRDPYHAVQIPPWRKPQRSQHGINGSGEYHGTNTLTGVDIYGLVDSWRSYKNGPPGLQASTAPALNPLAQPFDPSLQVQRPPSAHYTPYEPLRVSNGRNERRVVEAANTKKNKAKNSRKTGADMQALSALTPQVVASTEPAAGSVRRYSTRANCTKADQPIRSVEEPQSADSPSFAHALNQLSKYRRSRTRSPEAPETTAEYRSQAQKEPVRLSDPRKLLVVLDLNGTLLYRTKAATGARVHTRPGLAPLLDYLFTNHVVMIYTSAMPFTASHMLSQFLHPKYRDRLAAVWARDKLDLNEEQFANKVQVYKKLDKIWGDESIQKLAGPDNKWDQSNTVLVDDSKLKALAQPYNLLQVPEYTIKDDPARSKDNHKVQQDILKQLEMKLEELKYQEDVSSLIRRWQRGELNVPRLSGQEVVVEETVDQKDVKEGEIRAEPTRKTQSQPRLPTPESIRGGNTIEIPVRTSDDKHETSYPLSPVSSIDENTFKELLEDTRK